MPTAPATGYASIAAQPTTTATPAVPAHTSPPCQQGLLPPPLTGDRVAAIPPVGDDRQLAGLKPPAEHLGLDQCPQVPHHIPGRKPLQPTRCWLISMIGKSDDQNLWMALGEVT